MIKQTAMDMFFNFNKAQIPIASSLHEGFDVNYAWTYTNNNISLSYYLLGARANFRERFGLDQEILCIYDAHGTPDARIFSAIAELHNKYRARLDPAVVLIILEGDPERIQPMVNKNKEQAFVVIRGNELVAPGGMGQLLKKRFADVIGSIDLFSLSSPLETDTYLFGREGTLNEIVKKVALQGENGGIFGLRKTGKTSMLFALQRRFKTREILAPYVDCHRPTHRYRWWKFLEYIADRIKTDLVGVAVDAAMHTGYTEENCQAKFDGIVELALSSHSKIVLMLDEVEYISPSISGLHSTHWDSDFVPFWSTLRGIHQETHSRFSFLVAGVNPFIAETPFMNGIQNPIFQLIQPHYLEPLDEDTVRTMVQHIGKYLGMKFTPEVFNYLRQEFGGHAFLVRLACSEVYRTFKDLVDERGYEFNVGHFTSLKEAILSRLKSPVMDILLSLVWWYKEEYDLLRILAQGDSEFVQSYMSGESMNYLHVVNYGLISKETPDFHIRVIKDYIIKFGDEWNSAVNPFKRSGFTENELPVEADLNKLSEVYNHRASLEQQLRRVIYLYLNMEHGWNKVEVAKALQKGIKSEETADLFFGREAREAINEIYFRDLWSIMATHWRSFSGLFEDQKQRFDMNMDTIANVRNSDAHVKPLTDAEIGNFYNSYSWVKRCLDKVQQ
jgi:hypothetical protein